MDAREATACERQLQNGSSHMLRTVKSGVGVRELKQRGAQVLRKAESVTAHRARSAHPSGTICSAPLHPFAEHEGIERGVVLAETVRAVLILRVQCPEVGPVVDQQLVRWRDGALRQRCHRGDFSTHAQLAALRISPLSVLNHSETGRGQLAVH